MARTNIYKPLVYMQHFTIVQSYLVILFRTIQLVIPAALLTVDCLVIMLKNVQDRLQLGELLKMDEDVLKSIDEYYSNKGESFLYHLISNWFRDGPEEPLKLLIAGLKSLGEGDIATAISQLFSFGMNNYNYFVMHYTYTTGALKFVAHVCPLHYCS